MMRTLVLLVTACSTSYAPQSRGRVAVVMQSGAPAYVRDGRVYAHGFLGGGLQEVVDGHPAAMEAAAEYHDRMKYGLLGVLGGLVGILGGTVFMATSIDADPETGATDFDGNAKIGAGLAFAGLILMVAGGVYLASAEPYRWDAINLFNDTESQPPPLPSGPGWRASLAPRTSLRMRD